MNTVSFNYILYYLLKSIVHCTNVQEWCYLYLQVFGEGIEGKRSQEATILTEDNLVVFSEWGRWTDCNRCDQRGQRMRHGTCTVKVTQQLYFNVCV